MASKELGVNHISIDREKKLCLISTNEGFREYALTEDGTARMSYSVLCRDGVLLAERFASTNLIAFVLGAHPRDLYLDSRFNGYNNCRQKRCSYLSTITSVSFSGEHAVVSLVDFILVYEVKTWNEVYRIGNDSPSFLETLSGPNLWTLRVSTEGFLAYSNANQAGYITVFDIHRSCEATVIPAHTSAVRKIAFNDSGKLMATASVKGSVVRVFSLPDGKLLAEFRRGLTNRAIVHSLSFNVRSDMLACVTDRETLHIFKLPNDDAEGIGWMNHVGLGFLSGGSSPGLSRAFAIARIPASEEESLVFWNGTSSSLISVISSDLILYMFELDRVNGGDCSVQRKFDLKPTLAHRTSLER